MNTIDKLSLDGVEYNLNSKKDITISSINAVKTNENIVWLDGKTYPIYMKTAIIPKDVFKTAGIKEINPNEPDIFVLLDYRAIYRVEGSKTLCSTFGQTRMDGGDTAPHLTVQIEYGNISSNTFAIYVVEPHTTLPAADGLLLFKFIKSNDYIN